MGDPPATSLLKSLSPRASRIEAEVTRRLRAEFAGLVKPPPLRIGLGKGEPAVAGGTGGVSSGREGIEDGGGEAAVGASGAGGGGAKRRALLSCLRPFSALGSGIEAEKQFAR